jgi:hypothetical protein
MNEDREHASDPGAGDEAEAEETLDREPEEAGTDPARGEESERDG